MCGVGAGGGGRDPASASWGVSFTYKAGEAKPAALAAPAAARCSVYISDVSFHGAGAGAWFQWETSQACSGSFGSQKLQTQM
ncbi:hypothetical protein OOK36_42290 [Streptomyces sp. NBC_00365]|uniref:hypothetical protein n=1 Tax=Streptomyces sp. NBC_00365 TaxID=2975726 RepID=UPI00224FBA0A|nr:hypothetical protein [Streptomyces sp. NBC_00365]MCX5095358.1 hypothetical protein [Streptomyces sp. NBC_00365]